MSMSADRTSVFVRARKLLIGLVIAAPIIAWLTPVVLTGAGMAPATAMLVVLPLGLLWLIVGVVSAYRLACPRCGRSVFTGGTAMLAFGRPWPSRSCSRCGRDLTLPPS